MSARALLLLAVVALPLAGCSSTREKWAALELQDLTYSNLYLGVIDILDGQGFPVHARDPNVGKVESEWLYGTSVRAVFGPSRRKAYVEILPSVGTPGALMVRVRVAEQVIRKAGLRATRVRESDDWEDWEDAYDDAEFLAAKIRARFIDNVLVVVPVDKET